MPESGPEESPAPAIGPWDSEAHAEAAMATGAWVFSRTWQFSRGATSLDNLPPMGLPEIAFAGRSNVGKSSLINALVRHRGLARTSNTPGRTQEINYFFADDVPFQLVDMPGYGFAKAPKAEVAAWTAFVQEYLKGRASLVRVFLLVDARHGLKPNDRDVLDMLDTAAVANQVVLTKADKIPPHHLSALLTTTILALKRHPAAFPGVFATSAATGQGIEDLRGVIAASVPGLVTG